MRKATSGFTIVELLVVIAVIGILTAISTISYHKIQTNARDSERSSKINIISEALEKYYDKNGEYPSCAKMTESASAVSTNLGNINPDVLKSPTAASGTNSISFCDNLAAGIDAIAYVGDGSAACLTGQNCPNWTLQYREEKTGNIIIANSRRNAGISINLEIPSVPIVTPSTVSSITTFSWNTANCSGNPVRYQYRYTISPSGYDSGLISTAANSVAVTTSTQGQTYTVQVQAECYNTYNSSGMSAAGTSSYYRIITYILTLIAGINGSVNTGGTYNENSVQTTTATPDVYYVFSSWTGSTGCSGVASHTITMNANKSCTANFALDPNWIPGIAATVMAGKYIRSADLGSKMAYKTSWTAVTSPQGATGLDPNFPSSMSLVSPQTNPGVDFSVYPAQNACKAIGGRMPNMQELLAIYVGRATYGNNFLTSSGSNYWSSTDYNYDSAHFVSFYSGIETPMTNIGKISTLSVRCVSGL